LLNFQPNNAEVLNNLAHVGLRQNDPEAIKHAEFAVKLASSDPAILDTLGWMLTGKGDLPRAIAILRDARVRDAANPEIRYHLASALARSGRIAEARAELEESLKDGREFDGRGEASRLLAELSR
jgi:predicted Zn-dependent protease